MEPNELPAELPEKPEGWTQHLIIHMSFDNGGSATYQIKDETGREIPIFYGYDTRPPAVKGFKLGDGREIMSWQQLRAKWPEWRAKQMERDDEYT